MSKVWSVIDRNFGVGGGGLLLLNNFDQTYYEWDCHSDKCKDNKKDNKKYIMDIIIYLFYFVKDKKDLYGNEKDKKEKDKKKRFFNMAYDQMQSTMTTIAKMEKDKQRNFFCAQINEIKRKNYYKGMKNPPTTERKQHLFDLNYNAKRTILEIIACCYEEQLLTECLNLHKVFLKPCKRIYLPDPISDVNEINRMTVKTIGRLICLFDWNHPNKKKPSVSDNDKKQIELYTGEKRTKIANLTDALKGYVKIEFWRSQPMIALLIADIINGVGMVFGLMGNFYGPMLFIWRYILKWTNEYFDVYYEVNGHQGRMNVDNTLEGASPAINFMYRAFLKDTFIDAIEIDCIKSQPFYKRLYRAMIKKNKYADETDTDELCAETRTYRENLFEKHFKKFHPYKTSIFNYSLYHLAALKNKNKYLSILSKHCKETELSYRSKMTEKCKKVKDGEIPENFCDFNKKVTDKQVKDYGFTIVANEEGLSAHRILKKVQDLADLKNKNDSEMGVALTIDDESSEVDDENNEVDDESSEASDSDDESSEDSDSDYEYNSLKLKF